MKTNGPNCGNGGACTKASICCKHTIVPITDADVKRLMKASGLPADDIVRLYSATDLDYDNDDTWIRTGYGKRVMGLKKKGDACKFLDEHGLCRVYDHRPITCRTYPYMVIFDKHDKLAQFELNTDVECCGRLGPHWARKKLMADSHLEDREDDVYIDKLRAFERKKKRGKRELLKFLGLA